MPKRINPITGRGHRFIDRTGTRNGRLVFVRNLGRNKHFHNVWEAICDCGAVTTTTRPTGTLSCGCLRREVAAQTQRAKALPKDEKRRRVLQNRANQRARRKSDPIRAMHARISRLHRHALAQVGGIKSSPTFESLGYTAADLVKHIERQFLPTMSWENMSDWQLDHILPISTAKTADDVVALNQLSNLRPLWSQYNNKKKDDRTNLL